MKRYDSQIRVFRRRVARNRTPGLAGCRREAGATVAQLSRIDLTAGSRLVRLAVLLRSSFDEGYVPCALS